jgi:hypothetical protein
LFEGRKIAGFPLSRRKFRVIIRIGGGESRETFGSRRFFSKLFILAFPDHVDAGFRLERRQDKFAVAFTEF